MAVTGSADGPMAGLHHYRQNPPQLGRRIDVLGHDEKRREQTHHLYQDRPVFPPNDSVHDHEEVRA